MPSHPTLCFPTLHSSSFFPANASNSNMSSQVERVVLHTTAKSKSSHPMMQMTLPVDDDDDDDLLEPAAAHSSTSENGEDAAGPALHEASGATSRFADVHVSKKRVFSAPSLNRSFSKGAEKIPSLGRSFSKGAEKMPSLNRSISKGAEKIPSLGRSSSASATASRIVSKMAPMLRRVVSGQPSNNSQTNNNNSGNEDSKSNDSGNEDAPATSPRLGHNFLDSDDEDRDSLLFMMRVPVVRRKSHIPLMSLSHE
ncbi:hypothetical protein Gpo141_00006387 [Globisporangium polare]